jgi:hypothetical protein
LEPESAVIMVVLDNGSDEKSYVTSCGRPLSVIAFVIYSLTLIVARSLLRFNIDANILFIFIPVIALAFASLYFGLYKKKWFAVVGLIAGFAICLVALLLLIAGA